MTTLGKAEDPVVKRLFHKQRQFYDARLGLIWAVVNLLLAAAVYLEISYWCLRSYVSLLHPWIYYGEYCLAGLFTFNTLVNVMRYLNPSLYWTVVRMTPRQMKLLGVPDCNQSVCVASCEKPQPDSPREKLNISASSFSSGSPVASSHYPSPYTPPPAWMMSPQAQQHKPSSPINYNTHSPSPHYSHGVFSSSDHNCGIFKTLSPSTSPNASLSFNRSGRGSPLTPTSTLSPLFNDSMDASGLRIRLQRTSMSPSKPEECISEMKALDDYLTDQKKQELIALSASIDTSPASSPSFWNYNRSVSDFSHVLSKYQYQIACRSPQSTKSKEDDADDSTVYEAEEVWRKLGIHREQLDKWTENLRKWLSQTVMTRVMNQIQHINQTLTRIDSEDRQIGDVSVSTLKQLAVTKSQMLPHLNSLIPFLEVCANQEYLVHRIQELGCTGCMSEFRWDGGGGMECKPWKEHLPTDAAIVMHMFCTYMDSRLPPHPKYPDGKSFSSHHFLRTPDKPNLKKKDNLLIYQTRINPPHYKLVIEDDIWNIKTGRNNMFNAILLFLHHVKVKEHGMLGHVNLGLSGINILWVLEDL